MDKYSEIKIIREAIYGKVIHCLHKKTREHVAIKLMSLSHMKGRKAVNGTTVKEDGNIELFVMRMFRDHPHPHVLTLQNDFVYRGFRCLILEYCSQGELFDQLNAQKEKRFPENVGRRYFSQIISGLCHIHSLNIAHRDLSLENVLINSKDVCKISDFGLAAENGNACSGRVGKSFYMAPEVFRGGKYCGFKADVWSLGILLFIMLTGVPPLELPSNNDARFNVLQSQGIYSLLKMWRMLPWFSNDVVDLLGKMLRVPPEERISLREIREHPWVSSYFQHSVTPMKNEEEIVHTSCLRDTEILSLNSLSLEDKNLKKSMKSNVEIQVGQEIDGHHSPNTSDGSTVVSDESPSAEPSCTDIQLEDAWSASRKSTGRFNFFSSSCTSCNIKYGFAFFTMRHHCRYCYQSFCSDCSSKRAFVGHGSSMKIKRVCNHCFELLAHNDLQQSK